MNPLELIEALISADDPATREHALIAGTAAFQREVVTHDDDSLELGLRLLNGLWDHGELARAQSLAEFLAAAWTDHPIRHALMTSLAEVFVQGPDLGTALPRLVVPLIDEGGVTDDKIVCRYLSDLAHEATEYGFGCGERVAEFLDGQRDAAAILNLADADDTIRMLLRLAELQAAVEDPHARRDALGQAVDLQLDQFGFADRRSFPLIEALIDTLVDSGDHDRCRRILDDYQQGVDKDDPWPHLARFQYFVSCFQAGVPGSEANAFLRELRVLRSKRDILGPAHVIRSMAEAALALVDHSLNQADNLAIAALELLDDSGEDLTLEQSQQLSCLIFLARARITHLRGTDPLDWLTRAADLCDSLASRDSVYGIETYCALARVFAQEATVTARDHLYDESARMAEAAEDLLKSASGLFDALPATQKARGAPFIAHAALALGRARDDHEYSSEVATTLLRIVREIPSSRQQDIAETEAVVAEALLAIGSVHQAKELFAKAVPQLERRHGAAAPVVRRAVRLRRWPLWHSLGEDLRRLLMRERVLMVRHGDRHRGSADHLPDPLADKPSATSIARLVGERQRQPFWDDWTQAFGRSMTTYLIAAMSICVVGLPLWLFVLMLPFDSRYVFAVLGLGAAYLVAIALLAADTARRRRTRIVLEPDRIRIVGESAIVAREIVGMRTRWSGLGGHVGVSLADGTHRWLPSPQRYPWLPGNKPIFTRQYNELHTWVKRRGRVDGPVPRVPKRLVGTAMLVVIAAATLGFCVSKREVIFPWTPVVGSIPTACAALAQSGLALGQIGQDFSDRSPSTESVRCRATTTDTGADVQLTITRFPSGNVFFSAIGLASYRFRSDEVRSSGEPVAVPAATEAYLSRSTASVRLTARKANVIVVVVSTTENGRALLPEQRLTTLVTALAAQLRESTSA